MKKVLLVTNIPNPYRLPLFNELNKQLSASGISMKVVFGSLSDGRRKFVLDMSECRFSYEALGGKALRYFEVEKVSFTYRGLLRVIARENPDVIVTNGFSIATTKIWTRSWISRTPFIIWSGAIHLPMEKVAGWRMLQRRMLVRRAAGFIAYGSRAKEYLMSLGVPANKITIGINTVDTEFFKTQTTKLRDRNLTPGLNHNLLCISYLMKKKRLDQLFLGISQLAQTRRDFKLKVVGDGPELSPLRNLAGQLGIEDVVEFVGFVQKNQIPHYLAEADCFLFPTDYDVWGLVLVEAMVAGVPCIASIHAGATQDLINEGVTGFAVDFLRPDAVAEKINWILNNMEASREIGRNACDYIATEVSIKKSANGFTRAIMDALGRKT